MTDSQDHLVLNVLRLEPGESWAYRREALWFGIVFQGEGQCLCGSGSDRFAPGEVLVGHTASGIRVAASSRTAVELGWFLVRIEQLIPLFASAELFLLQNTVVGFKGARRHASDSILGRVATELLEGIPTAPNLDHRSRLLRVAAVVLTPEIEANRNMRASRADRGEDRFREVLAGLSEDQLLNLAVGDLAARFDCSRRHLNRLFHLYTGFSLGALRMEMRLLKAESLLREPKSKVIHVAGQCGFGFLSQFNACFKRRFGESPGRWRKRSESLPFAPARSEPGASVSKHGASRNGSGGATLWNTGDCPGTSGLEGPAPPRQAAA